MTSCLDCPSYLTQSQSATYFGKSIGAPVCATYGHVFGNMESSAAQVKKIADLKAPNCPSFGKSRPPKKHTMLLDVALPDSTTGHDPMGRMAPPSCAGCKFFVPEDVVISELKWSAGLCKAKGGLVKTNQLVDVANACDVGTIGPIVRSVDGVTLFPELESAYGFDEFVATLVRADPKGYQTDKPTTELDQAQGIVAWRKIVNTDEDALPHQHTFLPIMNGTMFSETELAKIPQTGSDEHPEEYFDHFGGVYSIAIYWMEMNQTPTLWGEPGTGKTEMYRHLSWLMMSPFERLSINRTTELDELAGKPHFSPEIGTYFVYGRLPLAWKKPSVICIDEPNTGPPEVWQFLRPLTDDSKQLALDMNHGEIISRHPLAYMGFAMNPAWDTRNVGAEVIADADTNRLMHITIGLPEPDVELKIIEKHVSHDEWKLDADQKRNLMKVATDIRALIEAGPLSSISWALRPQIKVARALRWFSPIRAYKEAIGNSLETDTREVILDVVRKQFK